MTRLTLALILAAFPAFANDPNWNGDDPEPEPPPPPVTVTIPNNPGGSVYDPYSRVYFATCSCTDFRTAWGFETEAFRRQAAEHQCSLRRERIGCHLTDPEAGAGVLK